MSPLSKQIQKEQRYTAALGVLLLTLAGLYMYYMSATIMHVVVRKEATQEMSDMNSRVATLEAEYIAAQHSVSNQVAALPGFVETPTKIFIERSDATLVVRDRLVP